MGPPPVLEAALPVFVPAHRRQVYGCHCEPVHGGPAKRAALWGEEPQGSVALLRPKAGAGHGGLLGDEAWQSVFPAGKLGKLVVLRANSLRLTNSPEVLLSVTPYRRRSGLPRRFAPRNDSGGGVIAPQCFAPADTRHVSAHLAHQTFLHPLTHARLLNVTANHVLAPAHTSFLLHVIANQCAHWCGNPFSPQKNSASWLLFGQIRSRLRIRPKYCFPSCCTAKSNGLPRRFAPRNDMQKHGRFQRVQAGTTR